MNFVHIRLPDRRRKHRALHTAAVTDHARKLWHVALRHFRITLRVTDPNCRHILRSKTNKPCIRVVVLSSCFSGCGAIIFKRCSSRRTPLDYTAHTIGGIDRNFCRQSLFDARTLILIQNCSASVFDSLNHVRFAMHTRVRQSLCT